MKLYYMPGACSLVINIALRVAGQTPELVKYDIESGKTEDGKMLQDISPKAYVPVLVVDDGEVLTEVVAILLYLAEKYPSSNLLPDDELARRRAIEWLLYTSTEIHKTYTPLFVPTASEAEREAARAQLDRRFQLVEDAYPEKGYLFGDKLTAADIYLFVTAFWSQPAQYSLEKFPKLSGLIGRAMGVAPVQAALSSEGLA